MAYPQTPNYMVQATQRKILVIRNDKLGDFTLALPSFVLLKESLPGSVITALVPEYTREIAELCPAIDHILIDPGPSANYHSLLALLKDLQNQHYDTVITLYSTTRIGILIWLSAIPLRYAPATKLAQLFYNRRVKQRRSQSGKPEYEYNTDIIKRFLNDQQLAIAVNQGLPYLQVDQLQIATLRNEFCTQYQLDIDSLLIFIHPGHGGSANNLSAAQYAELADKICSSKKLSFIISAGPGEKQQALQVIEHLKLQQANLYESTHGLSRFVKTIAFADLFISGSTGPLHIAGALNRPTCGFYTNRQSATKLRWQTLSSDDSRLAFSPPEDAAAEDMSRMDLTQAAHSINELIKTKYSDD